MAPPNRPRGVVSRSRRGRTLAWLAVPFKSAAEWRDPVHPGRAARSSTPLYPSGPGARSPRPTCAVALSPINPVRHWRSRNPPARPAVTPWFAGECVGRKQLDRALESERLAKSSIELVSEVLNSSCENGLCFCLQVAGIDRKTGRPRPVAKRDPGAPLCAPSRPSSRFNRWSPRHRWPQSISLSLDIVITGLRRKALARARGQPPRAAIPLNRSLVSGRWIQHLQASSTRFLTWTTSSSSPGRCSSSWSR